MDCRFTRGVRPRTPGAPAGRRTPGGQIMMTNTQLLLLGSTAAAAATPAPPTENCGVTTVAGSCWHNSDPESHIAEFQVRAPNVTAAGCICFGNCTAAPGCAHWHVRLPDEGMWTCDLRTSDVRPGASEGCTRDARGKRGGELGAATGGFYSLNFQNSSSRMLTFILPFSLTLTPWVDCRSPSGRTSSSESQY